MKASLYRLQILEKLIDGNIREIRKLNNKKLDLEKAIGILDIPDLPHNSKKRDIILEYERINEHIIEKLEKEIKEWQDMKNTMHLALGKLDNLMERIILQKRYIERKSLKEISSYLDISMPYVYQLHQKGLKNLSVYMKSL